MKIQRRPPPPKPMTMKDFLIQYVLNRAGISDNLTGKGAAEEAIKAWHVIKNAEEK